MADRVLIYFVWHWRMLDYGAFTWHTKTQKVLYNMRISELQKLQEHAKNHLSPPGFASIVMETPLNSH